MSIGPRFDVHDCPAIQIITHSSLAKNKKRKTFKYNLMVITTKIS